MRSPAHLIANVVRVIRSPKLAYLYLKWLLNGLFRSSSPVASFAGNVRFGGFTSFSEYAVRYRGLAQEDLKAIEAVRKSVVGSAIALDVGANLGLFSLALAEAGFSEIHAFEPVPDTYQRLVANLRLNPRLAERIVANRTGLGIISGSVNFLINPTSPGQNKIAPSNEFHSAVDNSVSCDLTTLDCYLDSQGCSNVSFLKLDVEGFECDVLKGGANALGRGRVRFIYSEVIPEALADAGSSVAEFSALLATLGFHPVAIATDHKPRFVKVSFDEGLRRAGACRNILFQHGQPL